MKEIKQTKIKKKGFKFFEKRVMYWRRKLGLSDWGFYVVQCELEGLARTTSRFTNKSASVWLAEKTFRIKGEDFWAELEDTALHEVLEVMLSSLDGMAKSRFSEEEVDEARHTVIQRLCSSILEK